MYTYWLAEKLKDTEVTANCIRVTNVKVDISRYPNLSKIAKFAYTLKKSKKNPYLLRKWQKKHTPI